MNKRIIAIFNIVFFNTVIVCVPLFAQSHGTIKGTIKDVVSKDKLPYANVSLAGTSLGSSTDENGDYTISNIPPGAFTIRVRYIGYRQEEKEIRVVVGETLDLDFELSPEFLEGEKVVVTAQAEGQKAAINEQLSSISIKNVVSAARIQELPDANAAESVARLPGVSLQREGGEGAKVVIRGLSPQYNRVTIDGVELPANATSSSPDDHDTDGATINQNFSLSGDRATNLSMISSNMLGGIEVIKAITPDMDATVLGGVVNFSMRKAAASSSSAPKLGLVSQGSRNALKDTYDDYKLVGSYEQRFLDDRFGAFLQGSIEQKNLSANELSAPYSYDGKIDVGEEGDPEISSVTLADVLRNRKRYGATLVLDYKYDSGSIGFLNFYSRSNTDNTRRSERYEIDSDNLFNSATYGTNELDVLSNLLSIKQDLVGLHMDLKLSHSYSGSDNPEDVRFNFWQDIAGFRDRYLALRYQPPKQIASNVVYNPDQSAFFDIYNVSNLSKDRTYNTALDVTKDVTLSSNLSGLFKVGATYQHRSRNYDYNESSGSVFYDDGGQVAGAIRQAYPQFGDDITYSDFVDNNYSYGTFMNGDFTLGSPMNVDLMRDVIEIAKKNPGTGNGGGYKPRDLPSLLYDYSGKEERSAAYAMSTFRIGDMFSVIPGVRYQNLTTTYEGIRGEQVPGGLQYTEAKETQSHGFWLPMAHFRFKPVDWFQFHFAYTNTLNYPDYNTIIPRFYVGSNFILYNNYKLKPATSENFDAIASVYSNKIGLLSFGGYKKTITDLIFSDQRFPSRAELQQYPEVYEIIKDKTEHYSLLTYINNPFDIDLWGIETEWQTHLWYLPGALSGIILNINYSHIFSEAQYPKSYFVTYPPSEETNWIPVTDTVNTHYTSRLLNQPKDVFNMSFGYDYRDFSLRLSVLYKDNIFKNPNFWASNWVQSDQYTRLDISVKQGLPWYNIYAFLNLNNLTGEDDVDIVERTGIVTSQQRYGMSADVGLRFVF